MTLDGNVSPAGRALFVNLGGDANGLSGGSRAAQFMLLKQALFEARSPERLQASDERLLTPLGRQTLSEFLERGSPFVFDVDRAADIRQVVEFARREKLRAVIAGGAEAWLVAGELEAAGVPVILDPLDNLPASFDKVGATLENAARLQKAGVTIAFSFRDPQAHNVRKIRQAAGNAVAHGLPPEAALAAMTRNPAEIFGVADRTGNARSRPAGGSRPLERGSVSRSPRSPSASSSAGRRFRCVHGRPSCATVTSSGCGAARRAERFAILLAVHGSILSAKRRTFENAAFLHFLARRRL